ncbi:MAG: MmgE/PrpD family protein, partial [Clostridia bacterium]
AYVSALEIACRMTLAATNRANHPWLTTTLFGVLGAALAAGRVRSLPEATLRHAVGIAYSSAGGNRQGLLDGAMIQRLQPGLSAQAGVAAVALASQGVTGATEVLEGRYGLYPSYYGADYEPRNLLDGLGREFRMLDLALKPYPCCSYSQEPIEAATELAHEPGFDAGAVKEVVVSVASRHAAGLVDRAYEPRSCAQVDAQFSMQYVIAATLVRGSLGLKDFQDDALHDRAVIDYARRVRVVVDEQAANTVTVTLQDGTQRSRRVKTARGHPSRAYGHAELLGKLAECASFGAESTVPDAQAIYDCVTRLEQLADIGELVRLIAPAPRRAARAAR